MLTLRSSLASPFGRKVKLAASILGLKDRIDIQDTDTTDPSDSIRSQNPLGKIPALVLENAEVLYDSAVILSYLDFLAGGSKIFPAGEARFPVLRDQALADGIMDAALLRVYEKRFREPSYRHPGWDSYQAEKVKRGLDHFEANLPSAPATAADIDAAAISLACALGYLDLRFEGSWRTSYPKLVAWLEVFEKAVPAYAASRQEPAPVSDTAPVMELK